MMKNTFGADVFKPFRLFYDSYVATWGKAPGSGVPGILGLAFAGLISADPQVAYSIALASSFILGFFIMSAGPIGFQYAAEVSSPAPESTSQGLLLLVGQISGLVFVAGMSTQQNAFLNQFMILFSALALLITVGVLFLNKSPMMKSGKQSMEA